ncbi:MAG: carboxyltransferase domain-containing protein, partial [Lysobacteraceae bacterium]
MSDWRIEHLGDTALLLRFGERSDTPIDRATNQRIHACVAALREQLPDWLVDLTPAYASLALHVDVTHIGTDDPLGIAERWLAQKMQTATTTTVAASRCVEIPVAYGGIDGPDLAALAAHAGITAEEVIARHTHVEYTVAMLGFAPGFPYLL